MSLQLASFFSGVGGIDLAFQRAGVPSLLTCEIDRAAASVLRRHFPDAAHHDDITKVTADDLYAAGLDPSRAVLAGGFPCQDLSVAGARRGMGEGTRSGLYWHLDRLMGEFHPAWVVLENVPGLLSSHGGRDMGAVVGSLADRGYGWSYRVLDAQHFGVPQRRRRVVIVGRLGDSGSAPAQVLLEPEGSRRDSAPGQSAGAVAATGPARGVVSALTANGVGICGPDDNQAQAGHFVPMTFQKVIRSGARDADGNLPPEVWAERDIAATLNLNDLGSETRAVELVVTRATTTLGDRTHALTAEGHDASEDGTGRGTPIIAATLTAGTSHPGVSAPGRRQEDDHNLVAFHTEVRRLTPLECERLQGHPDNWTKVAARPDGTTHEQSDTQRYRQMGNGVAVPVFEWVARRLVATDARTRLGVAA